MTPATPTPAYAASFQQARALRQRAWAIILGVSLTAGGLTYLAETKEGGEPFWPVAFAMLVFGAVASLPVVDRRFTRPLSSPEIMRALEGHNDPEQTKFHAPEAVTDLTALLRAQGNHLLEFQLDAFVSAARHESRLRHETITTSQLRDITGA